MVANASKEESMTGKHERLASRVPGVPGNGLIDRRALLGRGILFAGAAATGTGGSLTGAAAEPLPVDPWPSIRAAEINVETATTGDLQAAFRKGTLTSEKLTEIYLGRIAAYDKHGPAINAIITLNPNALGEARALDAERKAGKLRGPLHGIPIVLKDNFNTFVCRPPRDASCLRAPFRRRTASLPRDFVMPEPSSSPRSISANSQVAVEAPPVLPIRQY
jgi:hypothetical protein